MILTPKIRLSFLYLLPLLVSCVVMIAIVVGSSEKRLLEQNEHFSKTLTSYLARTTAQSLIKDDPLSINVLLSQMLNDEMLDFASVYDGNNQLVAQVGERDNDNAFYSQEITFQDTTAGYVQVGYNTRYLDHFASQLVSLIVAFHLGLGALALLIIWLAADFISLWVRGTHKKSQLEIIEPETPADLEPELSHIALLVIKIVPMRLAPRHRELMISAVALYGGRVVDTQQDDLLFQFRQSGAGFSAVCSGLLVQTLIKLVGPPIKVKIGIHWQDNLDDEQEEEKATKHASYLASIGEQSVLISRTFEQVLSTDSDVTCNDYHSSLAPDGEVFEVTSVKNFALIESQAAQLLNKRL